MLRNAIIHVANDQPFLADLVEEPGPNDVSLVCRNVRTMNGKKPVFVDYADSTFVMPISQVRFIEIPARAYSEEDRPDGDSEIEEIPVRLASRGRRKRAPEPGSDTVDSRVALAGLRRVGSLPEDDPPPEMEPEPRLDGDGLDVDLLRRIHEA